MGTSDCHPSHGKQKMADIQTAVLPLHVGAHQCGVLMVYWDDWLSMYPPPVQTLVVSNKGRQGGYSLRTGTID